MDSVHQVYIIYGQYFVWLLMWDPLPIILTMVMFVGPCHVGTWRYVMIQFCILSSGGPGGHIFLVEYPSFFFIDPISYILLINYKKSIESDKKEKTWLRRIKNYHPNFEKSSTNFGKTKLILTIRIKSWVWINAFSIISFWVILIHPNSPKKL